MKHDFGPNLHLVFYSGGKVDKNKRLHRALSEIKKQKLRSFTYIPYSHENGLYFYRRIVRRYKNFGFKKFRYFACDTDFLKKEMREALKSDVVYLAGGNTFYFLKHLRQAGMLGQLKKFVQRGGVLAGLSAGAIIMTPHIYLAGYPPHEGDENEVRLKNLKSLKLVDFEFLPHYSNSAKTNKCMVRYSKKCRHPIYACPDGSGIIITKGELKLVGPVYMFLRGRKTRLV